MTEPIKVVQFGLGPIGVETAKTVLEKSRSGRIKLVGAVDIDPSKVGKDLSEIFDTAEKTGIEVSDNALEVFQATKPHVVLHTTSSFVEKIYSQLELCIQAGVNVISSAEELFYPFERHPKLSQDLDALAKRHNVVVLGTGINPGFVMDTLALVSTGVCNAVRSMRVERVVDASKRRLPLQKKIGAGLTLEEFEEKKKTGTFGHIGLLESALFLANGLGWKLSNVQETLEPLIADREIKTPFLTVSKGQVRGIHHCINGNVNGKKVLTFELKIDVSADDPHDAIYVDGDPPVNLEIRNGLFGDSATVAALVNAIPLVIQSSPGLKTMKDLPIPRVFVP